MWSGEKTLIRVGWSERPGFQFSHAKPGCSGFRLKPKSFRPGFPCVDGMWLESVPALWLYLLMGETQIFSVNSTH